MSDEHGWAGFGDDAGHDDPVTPEVGYGFESGPGDDLPGGPDDDLVDDAPELPDPDDGFTDLHPDDHADMQADAGDVPEAGDLTAEPAGHLLGPVGADPDATLEADTAGVFPPLVDVGALPEPVDGFPWIDTGSLGVVDPVPPVAAVPVDAAELAAYAGQELPPAADPWAALAAAEDPATSALARWWHPEA